MFTTVKSDDPSKDYITDIDRVDILVKPLSDGSAAISFINVSERKQTGDFKLSVDDIPFDSFKKGTKYKITDLWTGEETENADGIVSIKSLDACDSYTVKISAI